MLGQNIGEDREGLREPVRHLLSEKYVHARRAGEILAAFSRFGFGKLWDAATLLKEVPFDSEARDDLAQEKSSVRLRLLLEDLGPTFIKLGQMLSTRPDLISEAYADELGALRDRVPPFSFKEVKETIKNELGKEITELFRSFDEEPVASASIGQVHAALLKDGKTRAAVKIQRPDVDEIIKADMEILHNMANILSKTFKHIEHFEPEGVIEEFEHMIKREIDYTLEGRNIERFRKNLASEKKVVIPKVYWQYSTKKVLTMEYMDGIPLDQKEKLKSENVDMKSITDTLGATYIKQIFIDGFFHADPHQDNVFVLKGNNVCFLDFGAIGYMDDETRDLVATFYIALITENTKKAAESLIQLSGTPESDVNFQRLEWDLRDLLDYNVLQRAKVPVDSGANQRIIDVAMKHGVMLPSSFVLFERAMAQIDGVCRTLNPEFDIVEIAKKNIMPVLRERYQMKPEPLEALETAREYRKFMSTLPKRADAVMKKLESDDFSVKIDGKPLEDLKRQIRKTGYVLAVSIILATLMINIAISGNSIDIDPIPISLSAVSIVVIWIIAIFFIHRRL